MRLILILAAALTLGAQAPSAPKPTPHHEAMKTLVGTWDAVVKVFAEPGKPPMESKAVEVNALVPGGLWLQTEFKSDMMGTPFEGRGLFGFDPATGKHVGVWVDSMVSSLALPSGTCKDGCRETTLVFKGVGMDGKPATYKEVSVQKDADHRTMSMYLKGKDGKVYLDMVIEYTRRK